jgi:hypothetical protein
MRMQSRMSSGMRSEKTGQFQDCQFRKFLKRAIRTAEAEKTDPGALRSGKKTLEKF